MGAVLALLLVACAKQTVPSAHATAGESPFPASWLGKWNGPEGTWLEIAGTEGAYIVTVSNLDGPRRFAAAASNGTLSFERDGVQESLRATDGAGTGMKWLAEKTSCLTIKSGEGFCRD